MVVHAGKIYGSEIIQAVVEGLGSTPKKLPSWLFYDRQGDSIFQKIMRMPTYYPTRSETEILHLHREELARYCIDSRKAFHLIELGAGDGTKTEILLRTLLNHHARFTYMPVDISANVLQQLTGRLRRVFPGMPMESLQAEYSEALTHLDNGIRKVILFLGANIGNMTLAESANFLSQITARLTKGDMLIIGCDLKKDPRIIEAAYDDPHGITREFNLNVLARLNRETGANFDLEKFQHYPYYNPETGTASSYLISLADQNVFVKGIERNFRFSQWESIHMEISQKYDLLMIEKMLTDAGLELTDLFFDKQYYFCDVVATRIA